MVRALIASALIAISSVVANADERTSLPKDVPPVIGTAITLPSFPSSPNEIMLSVPKVAWDVVGERRPKIEWPEFKVSVKETSLILPLVYDPASQLSEEAQNRILDMKGNRLSRDEVEKRLKSKKPVLFSVSGRMPDAFYLQCTKPDTLIVVLGIPSYPAPELLPHKVSAKKTTK
jgi:hypothetical protein